MFCSYLLILCTVFHIKILFLTKNSRRTAAGSFDQRLVYHDNLFFCKTDHFASTL